jgi:hypothetical protein
MSNKTIAKFATFVIFTMASAILFQGCSQAASETTKSAVPSYDLPVVVGRIHSREIGEASGIAASRCQPDVYWLHNDSGNGPYIFAVNGQGISIGTWKVTGATNVDWEDIAIARDASGKCSIYIGEIGDNKQQRVEHAVYRIEEPTAGPQTADSTAKQPLETATAQVIRYRYPDYIQNAETLLVHPASGEIYVVTKRISGPAGIYRIPATDHVAAAEKIGEVAVPAVPNGLLTGGDISPDGRRLVLCDYSQGYEYTMPSTGSFTDIWKQEPETINIGKRDTGEAVGYAADGSALVAVSEGINQPLIRIAASNRKGQP